MGEGLCACARFGRCSLACRVRSRSPFSRGAAQDLVDSAREALRKQQARQEAEDALLASIQGAAREAAIASAERNALFSGDVLEDSHRSVSAFCLHPNLGGFSSTSFPQRSQYAFTDQQRTSS